MDKMMGRARFLGRAAVLGVATFATLLAVGTSGVADAAQTVTRASGISPQDSIPCTLTVSNPAYYTGSGGSGVQATATIRCAYPTTVYIQVGLSYNGNTPVYKGQSFPSTYVASLTITTSATPGYYQANGIAILGDGQQFGTYYSSNVYIPQ
jgi:hypothetical protein